MRRLGDFNTIKIDGMYQHPALTNTEQTVAEIIIGDSPMFGTTFNIDVSSLSVDATFLLYCKIDDVNYRRRFGDGPAGGRIIWTVGSGDWVSFLINGIWDHDLKITIQSDLVGEVSTRSIPYSYNGAR